MADHATGRRGGTPVQAHGSRWSARLIAEMLVPRRDWYVERLPRELPSARSLTTDQRELVVDEAIDYLVTEYPQPIEDRDGLERVFWATAAFRVRRMHEGRGATVRAGWRRVELDGIELPGHEADPQTAALARAERETLIEFVATLTERERQVLACKYRSGPKELGRIALARMLGLPIGEVRRAERTIARKLDRFAAIISAGTLCAHRDPAVTALATGNATAGQELAARAHLLACAACRVGYNERMLALRTGELQRKLAGLLPVPPTVADTGRHRGVWDALGDWAARPFASDPTSAAAQIAASGGGRGLGAVAAAKLAAICLTGATAVGGGAFCLQSGLLSPEQNDAGGGAKRTVSADEQARLKALPAPARPALVPARKSQPAKPRSSPKSTAAATRRGSTSHEREVPISPAPSGSLPDGQSEFAPGPATTARSQPARVPTSGGPEFP